MDGTNHTANRPVERGAVRPATDRLTLDWETWRAVLRPLAPLDRRVVLWRFVEGLTFDAIGGRLGFTLEGARQVLVRALGVMLDRAELPVGD